MSGSTSTSESNSMHPSDSMSMHHTHSTSTSRLSSEATTSTSESQSTLSATSEVTKHNGTPAQSEKRLPDTGDSIKQNGLLGGVMTLLVWFRFNEEKEKER